MPEATKPLSPVRERESDVDGERGTRAGWARRERDRRRGEEKEK
jgi:hypothetical protein